MTLSGDASVGSGSDVGWKPGRVAGVIFETGIAFWAKAVVTMRFANSTEHSDLADPKSASLNDTAHGASIRSNHKHNEHRRSV